MFQPPYEVAYLRAVKKGWNCLIDFLCFWQKEIFILKVMETWVIL